MKKIEQWRSSFLAVLFLTTGSKSFAVQGTYLSPNTAPKSSCMVIYYDQEKRPRGLCSGDIIGSNKFLTAAHCELDSSNYSAAIICQDDLNKAYKVNAVRVNPNYDLKFNQFDQAMLQVETPFPRSSSIKIPNNKDELIDLVNSKKCEIWGYGLDNNNKPAKLNGISAEFNGAILGDGLIGVGGHSYPIQGDSGGGLYCKGYDNKQFRVGTVSRAEKGISSIASLKNSLDWIHKNVNGTFKNGEFSKRPPLSKAIFKASKTSGDF
jgi:hypothetical protein